ncbi:hypothetical protein OAN307_c39250 [Octadecabacter antarcticus 307]|uniref:Uncharacterized protein n=1 Tax=Octadecabacter antarcticus 307 TaxID=391626 RepID=M9RHP7_9RHOB|nr:hypothetical protein OAN307_c39250 [Octadecabacter antarcticus 307]
MSANGLGPWWLPDARRRWLTGLSSLFFDEAGWREHDKRYRLGDPQRSVCDFKFLAAMCRDASRTTSLIKLISAVRWRSFLRAGAALRMGQLRAQQGVELH